MPIHRQTVLAIAEDDHTRKVIRQGMPSSKYTLHLAGSPNECRDTLLKLKPEIIILSIEASARDSLLPLIEICEADPQARVIVVSSSTDSAFVLECIRRGASDCLRKPLKPKDLQHSIDRIASRNRMMRKALEPDRMCVQEERKTLKFGNDIDNLPYIINQAVTNASVVCPDIPMLKTALGEVLLNAIEHGNLNISMKEKSAAMEKNTYRELLDKRMKDPRFAGKLVTLHVSMTQDKLTYRVIDQGNGFNHKSLFNRDPYATVGSGLGLFVVKSFFTRLSFRGRGNEVVLVFRKRGD